MASSLFKKLTNPGEAARRQRAGGGAVAPDDDAEKLSAEERKKEEQREKIIERNQTLLPWTIEQKVSCCLNPIKVPVVIIVFVLGCAIENRVNWTTQMSWRATNWRAGPVCYVHRLNSELHVNHTFQLPPQLVEPLNNTVNTIIDRLGVNGTLVFNHTLLNFRPDVCGITPGLGDDGGCSVGPVDENNELTEHTLIENGHVGLNQYKVPFVYFSLVWAVYKIFFMPVHWPDRLVRQLTGDEFGEPIFKLLTMPYYQKCTGPMSIISKIGGMIRYAMLPNTLLVPLATMGHTKDCSNLYYYRMDHYLSLPVYVICLLDFLWVIGLMALGQTVYGGKCIGTCAYRVYKFFWTASLPLTLILWLCDLWFCFELRFWKGWMVAINVMLDMTVSFEFNFAVDLVEAASGLSVALDTLQFFILILSLLCPFVALKLPVVGKFLEEDKAEEEAQDDEDRKALLK